MSKTVSQFKSDLQGALHGTNLNKVQGLDDVMYRAAGDLLLDIDPRETMRTQELSNALYDAVYDYALPSDLKGTRIVDIRPQVNRAHSDNVGARYSKEFDLYKDNNTLSIQDNGGVKTIRISKPAIAGILLNECESLTANGTIQVNAAASNLSVSSTYFVTGGRSLEFDMDGTDYVGTLLTADMTEIDLSAHEGLGSIFVWLYMPVPLASVVVSWGDTGNAAGWYTTITAPFDATAFRVGWNLLRADWSTASKVGLPNSAAVGSFQIDITQTNATAVAVAGYRVDSVYSKLPSIWEIEYYSKFLFRTSAGTWQESITDDSNIINLDTESYNLYFDRIMILLAPQLQGKDSAFDLTFYSNHYKEARARYVAQNKSQAQRPQSIYYRQPFKPTRTF